MPLQVSTVAQFRMRSYGMERCIFVVNVPEKSTARVGEVILDPEEPNKHIFVPGGFELRGDTSSVELWKLDDDAQVVLNANQLTYKNKPRRKYLLASLNISPGETTRTREFPCREDSLQTFELVCPWADCFVNWWQIKFNETLGEY
jgi:hypothetical protein